MRFGDVSGAVIGRIMRHPQAPGPQPWFWTITAREQAPSVSRLRSELRTGDTLRRGTWDLAPRILPSHRRLLWTTRTIEWNPTARVFL